MPRWALGSRLTTVWVASALALGGENGFDLAEGEGVHHVVAGEPAFTGGADAKPKELQLGLIRLRLLRCAVVLFLSKKRRQA